MDIVSFDSHYIISIALLVSQGKLFISEFERREYLYFPSAFPGFTRFGRGNEYNQPLKINSLYSKTERNQIHKIGWLVVRLP